MMRARQKCNILYLVILHIKFPGQNYAAPLKDYSLSIPQKNEYLVLVRKLPI